MKQDLRIAVTKRMIKESLLRLLENKPLDKIKVSELCAESGVNRATFYRHYESTQEVLREIETELIRQMPHPTKPPRSIAAARDQVEIICTYFFDNAHVVRLLYQNRTDQEMLQNIGQLFQSVLALRKDEICCPETDSDTLKVIIALVAGGSHNLLRQWLMGDIRKTPGEMADILCNVIHWPDPNELTCQSIAHP